MKSSKVSLGIELSIKKGGGGEYKKMMLEAFKSLDKDHYDLNEYFYTSKSSFQLLNIVQNLLYNAMIKGKHDVWIRDVMALTTFPFDRTHGKNLCVFFHLDDSHKPALKRVANWPLNAIFFSALKKVDGLIVISQYWKDYFKRLGYSNIFVLYDAFDIDGITSFQPQTDEFKKKYQLEDKPIIYIGNCQKSKGVVEVYQALKDLDVYLVTSGRKDVEIPAQHLDLSYQEYLTLLKVSSVVVTMSKFKEGWCRTAHEAMLCRTPVVGSGLGGMGELLSGGHQCICSDISKLKENVNYALIHPEIGNLGYIYASNEQFSLNQFQKSLGDYIESVLPA